MTTICLRRLCTTRFAVRSICNLENRTIRLLRPKDDVRLRKFLIQNTRFTLQPSLNILRSYTDDKSNLKLNDDPPKKKTLLQRFKQMYRDYWYVLLPVHLVTSAGWFGSFYYLAKSGVDITALLESWHVSETITDKLKDSSMGYIAVSYALYKIATPLRYTVTLGGTTISINYLKKWGYIKPVPSKDQLKEIYKEKKENIIESIREKKELYKEKKDNIMDSVRESKIEFQKKGDADGEKTVVNGIKKEYTDVSKSKK